MVKQTDLNAFYSEGGIVQWKQVIGSDLHYHFGDFEHTTDPEEALKNVVRNYYPYIPRQAKVLDLGCGWGGPAKLLRDELGCEVTGVTISERQYQYCKGVVGINTLLADIEQLDFGKLADQYDVVIMIESPEHILNKMELFQKIGAITEQLIVRATCLTDDVDMERWTFGNSIYMCTENELSSALKKTGWAIQHRANRRFHSIPTIAFWKKNMAMEIKNNAQHIAQYQSLYELTKAFDADPIGWCECFPLIDIIAKRIVEHNYSSIQR